MNNPSKRLLIAYLNEGAGLPTALSKSNISYQSYRQARSDDPEFGIKVDNARAQHFQAQKSKGVKAGGYVPTK